jgi:hypothetical protein
MEKSLVERKEVVPLRRFKKEGSNETNGLKSNQKKVEKTSEKVWRYKKELYFCAALRKKRSNETSRS